MKLTGREGVLRIYDSAAVLHGAAPLDSLTMDVVTFDGDSTWANITSDVDTDDASAASAFLADNGDYVFIGSTSKFALVKYLKGAGSNYGAGTGALKAYYFDGTDFSSALTGVTDGTASGGDCFAQDGNISFRIPRDWAIGANSYNANLDSDKYYIALQTTTSGSTDPDADVLAPVDAQYFMVKFSEMDFNGPIGRPLTEEQLVLNRNKMDSYAHYIKGPDDVIYQPMEISFSCKLDTTYNKNYIFEALECDNPNTGTWTSTGTTSKGTTQNDGSNDNPAFDDASKKTVNIQVLWTGDNPLGMAYYEVYFPKENQGVQESETDIILTCRGGVYGVIEQIFGFGVRY
jgi:hypothetical protein